MLHSITKKLDSEIAKYNKPANQINYQRWFKEKLKYPVGLKTEFLKKISNECFKIKITSQKGNPRHLQ
jgi:hypothetical protein